MKRVLVSGYIGFNNFGDEAIFYVLSSHLKEIGYRVNVLANNPKIVSDKYKVDAYYYKCPFCILKALLCSDVLISGGGSLLQNKTSNFSLIYYLMIILLAKILSKKVIIFAQGIEPIKGKFFKFLVKNILNMADFISVRDEKSQKLLLKSNIKSNLLSDPVYYLTQDKKKNDNKNGLVIQLRKYKGINEEFLSNLSNAIKNNYQGDIKILSLQDDIDLEICKKFQMKLNELNIKSECISENNINDVIDILNNAKYMISMRLHGLIVSSSLSTRCFALAYDEKIKTLIEELNLENIDIYNYTKEEMNEKMKMFFDLKQDKKYDFRRFSFDIIDEELKKDLKIEKY